jgi:hypothetical protein
LRPQGVNYRKGEKEVSNLKSQRKVIGTIHICGSLSVFIKEYLDHVLQIKYCSFGTF